MTDTEDRDLVARTAAATAENERDVRSILARAGALEREGPRGEAPRLTITRAEIVGSKTGDPSGAFRYERRFDSGVWVTRAPNQRGKSTLMRCMTWALTGDRPHQTNIRTWVRSVAVEFGLGTETYLVAIDQPPGDARPIAVVATRDGEQWKPVSRLESEAAHERFMNDLFERAYTLDALQWFQSVPGRAQPALGRVRWGTFARGVSLDQDLYAELIVAPALPGAQNQKVLAALLDLPYIARVNRAEIALQRTSWEKSRTAIVTARHGGSAEALEKQRSDLESQLAQISSQLVTTPAESRLGRALAALDATQRSLSAVAADVLDAEREADAGDDVIDALRARLNLLTETIGFRRFFNGIEVSHCPRCERAVQREAKERERESGECRVCGSPVAEEVEDRIRELESERTDLIAELAEVKAEVEKLRTRHDTLENRRERLHDEWEQRSQAVREASTDAAEVLTRRDALNQELGQVRERLAEMAVETPEALEQQERVLRSAVQLLRERQSAEGADRVGEFQTEVLRLALAFGISEIDQVTFSTERGLRISQGGMESRFEDLDIGARLRLKIAVFVALALMSARGHGRHPRLLLVDSPGQTEMNDADLAAMARALRAIEKEHGEDIEVIVATQERALIEGTIPAKQHVAEGPLF